MGRHSQWGKQAIFIAGLGWLLTQFAGCASNPSPHQIAAEQNDVDRLSRMQAIEAVQELEQAYTQAEKQNLSVFAPEHYKVASQAVVDARQLLLNKESIDKIATKVAVAEAVIRSGSKVTDNVSHRLSDEIKLKEKLLKLRANDTYSQDFDSLNSRLSKLIQQLENGKASDVDAARPSLQSDMNALIQRTARYNALNEPETILRRVKRRGGDEMIPVTYAEAQAVLQSADNFVKANPQNIEAIEKLGEQALFAARRALFVADEVATLQHNVKFSLEQIVLDEEYRLNQISRHLTAPDVRDNPLEVQAQKIAEQVYRLKEKSADNERLVNVMRQAMAEGEDANDKIVILTEELQRLETEKNEWTAKEALYNAKITQLLTEQNAKAEIGEAEVIDLTKPKRKGNEKSQAVKTANKSGGKPVKAEKAVAVEPESAVVQRNEPELKSVETEPVATASDDAPSAPAVVAEESKAKAAENEKTTKSRGFFVDSDL